MQKRITINEFKGFVNFPENSDRLYELVNGEIIEVLPGSTSKSALAHLIVAAVYPFCHEHHIICRTSGCNGAYEILGNVVAPDFAYKRTPMSDEYPDPEAPLWTVEIISPTDKADNIRAKRQIYIRAGILYWEIYPLLRSVDVYAPGKPIKTFEIDDVLDGGEVLPGFTLPMKTLFPTA